MERLIFLRVGWMNKYRGLKGDKIIGGGSFVETEHYGHEIFNFKPYNGMMYGYAKSPGETINIERIVTFPLNNDFVGNVTVIWVATKPNVGSFIIGWYKNAKVYKNYKKRPVESYNFDNNDEFLYMVKAKLEDCVLLPPDERIIDMKTGKNGMGQSNVWYAEGEENKDFRKMVLDYVYQDIKPLDYINEKSKAKQKGMPLQVDPEKRKKVEDNAINETTKFYEKLGYSVNSVESDNKGWDLEVSLGNKMFKVEVKGLSGSEIIFELTPNEYDKMKKFKEDYIICVLTNALNSDHKLHRFFSDTDDIWEDTEGNILNIQEMISARCSIN